MTKPHPRTLDFEYTRLDALLNKIACDNIAPIPIAMALDEGKWTVDIHVKIKGVKEYEVTGTDAILSRAIQLAYRGLANQTNVNRNSATNQKIWGYEI